MHVLSKYLQTFLVYKYKKYFNKMKIKRGKIKYVAYLDVDGD